MNQSTNSNTYLIYYTYRIYSEELYGKNKIYDGNYICNGHNLCTADNIEKLKKDIRKLLELNTKETIINIVIKNIMKL